MGLAAVNIVASTGVASAATSCDNDHVVPGVGNLSNQDIANMAAMTRAMAGMHHHRGGVTGPAQAGAMQQMQAQQMMLRQQYAGTESRVGLPR